MQETLEVPGELDRGEKVRNMGIRSLSLTIFLISKLLTRLECHNFLFRKTEYEYVLYSVQSIRMTRKT